VKGLLSERLGRFRTFLSDHIFDNEPVVKRQQGAAPPTRAQWQSLLKARRFSATLPYEYYDEASGFFYNDDSFGFVLELTPATSLSEENIRVIAGILGNNVEPQTNIQFVLYASPDVYPLLNRWYKARASLAARKRREQGRGGDEHRIYEELARRRVEYLAGGLWQSFFSDEAMVVRDYRVFVCAQRPLPESGQPREADIEQLDRLRSGLSGTYQSVGLQTRQLAPAEFVNLLDTMLNPRKLKIEQLRWQEDVELREQVVDGDTSVYVGAKGLLLENGDESRDVRCFTVREYPPAWAGWLGTDLIGDFMNNNRRISCPFLTTLTVHFPDQVQASATAKTKSMRATQMADSDAGKHVPSWADKKREWQFVAQKLEQGHTLAKVNYQTILFAPQGRGNECEQELLSVYKSAGWQLSKESHIAMPAFLSALPLGAGPRMVREAGTLIRWRSLLTWTAANIAPTLAEWKGDGSPLLQLIGRRGQLISVDPWQNKAGNYNIAVSAASGAGKSVFTEELITSVLGVGGRAWVFDRGRSYEHLCQLLGGQFIEFSPQSDICLNPFTNIRNWSGTPEDDAPTGEEQGQARDRAGAEGVMLKYVVAQMVNPDKSPDPMAMGWIERALNSVWQERGTEGDITAVRDVLAASSDRRQRDLADSLYPYTRDGFFGRYFNGRSNLDLNRDFVVLETQELDARPELQSVVVLLLMLRITQAMYLGERERRKLCVIDEAWKLMGRGNAGQFIEEGYRTARKFEGAFATITQRVNDYYKSGTAQAALDNADFLYLLRQKKESIRQLIESKRLPTGEDSAALLASINTRQGRYSEVAVVGPDGVGVGRLVLDPFTEKLYSSRGAEYEAIQRALRNGQSLSDAVSALAAGASR
jgi:conjugal transfer ATP-binding protein TraC